MGAQLERERMQTLQLELDKERNRCKRLQAQVDAVNAARERERFLLSGIELQLKDCGEIGGMSSLELFMIIAYMRRQQIKDGRVLEDSDIDAKDIERHWDELRYLIRTVDTASPR